MGELPPLQSLLLAYAPAAERAWQRLCWLLDQRLATVVRRGGEPTIAAIRLAWWDEVLVANDLGKGRGEPLVDAWRATAPEGAGAFAEQLIDGWRLLLGTEPPSPEELADHGAKRGAGLFGLLSGRADESLVRAGATWALWDFAAHSGDRPALARTAMTLAQAQQVPRATLPRGRALKPLRLAYAIASGDAAAARVPERGFEARHYRRLLWRALLD